jgi:hypothetical protein
VNDFVFAIRLGSTHLVTGSLSNVSVGGDNATLSANLQRWKAFTEGLYQFGKPVLNFTLGETSPYTVGFHLSWGTDGRGVSSTHVDFILSLKDRQVMVQLPYAVNVTTALKINGSYREIVGDTKRINVTLNLSNEGGSALAKNITMLYEYLGEWRIPDFQTTNYGNGTYLTSFEVDIPGNDVYVSAQVYDSREIYVQANATCTNAS